MMNSPETWEQTAQRYIDAPDVSFWLKAAIKANRYRDPVDALGDADLLYDLMKRRADAVQAENEHKHGVQRLMEKLS